MLYDRSLAESTRPGHRTRRGPLAHLREMAREFLYRRATTEVLVIGDSHVRVFEHWRFLTAFPGTRFKIVYVPGATASGIRNKASVTRAYSTFSKALNTSCADLVLVNLGEVDTGYTLWHRAQTRNCKAFDLLDIAVINYSTFLREVCANHNTAVISACLPTLAQHTAGKNEVAKVRARVMVPQVERTELALEFNRRVHAFCVAEGIPYLSSDAAALGPDGLVRPAWLNRRRPDHHYARPTYARWLIQTLRESERSLGVRLA